MPIMQWQLDETTVVRPLELGDTHEVYTLITQNRQHLDRWLRWSSALQSEADVKTFIEQFQGKLGQGDGFHCGIWNAGQLAGGGVCWYINRQNKNAEVGYWLGEAFVGRGLVTRAVESATEHLFEAEQLHRLEMQCGAENGRSRAVPERLGFTLEGVRRQSHWITDRFVDHAVYGLLADEWARGARAT